MLRTNQELLLNKSVHCLYNPSFVSIGNARIRNIKFHYYVLQARLQAGQGYGSTFNCVLTVYRNETVSISPCLKDASK